MTKKCRTGDFFFIFAKKFFFLKKWTILSNKTILKCGGKKSGRPTGHNFGHPLDRKQTFFCGQPEKKKKKISFLKIIVLPGDTQNQRPYIIETMHSYTLPM